jgi:hypothetical protein
VGHTARIREMIYIYIYTLTLVGFMNEKKNTVKKKLKQVSYEDLWCIHLDQDTAQ